MGEIIKLNTYGKSCLKNWAFAISASDITDTTKEYLYNKGVIDYKHNFLDSKDRIEFSGHCLTDDGIETVKHYIPNYWRENEV